MLDESVSIGNTFNSVDYQQWKESVAKIINADPDDNLIYNSIEGIDLRPLDLESRRTIELKSFPWKIKVVSHIFADEDNVIDLVKIHNAGASIIQELVFGLNQFCQKMDKHKSIEIHIACDSLYFSNVCKLRALRFICERIIEESQSQIEFNIFGHNSLREQTLFDPWVNMLRSTVSSMAAIIGGANQISSHSYDQLFSTLTGKNASTLGRRQADNILKILLEESHLNQVKDPAKGSYTVDNLTEQIIEKVWKEFQGEFDEEKFIKNVSEIASKRYELAQKRKLIITGVNNFANAEETLTSIYQENFSFDQDSDARFPLRTVAFEFEKLRTQININQHSIHIVMYGSEAKLSGRANFCKNYFELLGLKVNTSSANTDIQNQLDQFKKSKSAHAIICALDEDYEKCAQDLIDGVQNAGADKIYLAGKVDKLKFKNVTDRIYMGQNVYRVLSEFVGVK